MLNTDVSDYLKSLAKKYDSELFIHPPLNGERVEYVLLGKKVGICLVEVIDSKNLAKITKDVPLKLQNLKKLNRQKGKYDCIILAVAHKEFVKMKVQDIFKIIKEDAYIIDIKGVWNKKISHKFNNYWCL